MPELVPQEFHIGEATQVGLLYLPEGEGWYPAVVVAGDPASDEPEAGLPQHLTALGFAVLTFDAGERDLPAALMAAADSLLMRPDINPERIGLLGLEAGAWAAGYVAARAPETAFAVLVPGAAPPSDGALAYLGDVLCPALVLSPNETMHAALAEALANNPDADLQPAHARRADLYARIGAWLKDQVY